MTQEKIIFANQGPVGSENVFLSEQGKINFAVRVRIAKMIFFLSQSVTSGFFQSALQKLPVFSSRNPSQTAAFMWNPTGKSLKIGWE